MLKTEDFGLKALNYVQLNQLDDDGIQSMIDYVIQKLGFLSGNKVSYKVQSGKEFTAIKEYFMFCSHDLESKIKNTWKELNKVARGGDNLYKN